MSKHADEECPKCGEIFVCKVNNISQCDCNKISLTTMQSQFVRDYCEQQFGDYSCLCNTCLLDIVSIFEKNEMRDEIKNIF
jgi:Cysteine-rich CWC